MKTTLLPLFLSCLLLLAATGQAQFFPIPIMASPWQAECEHGWQVDPDWQAQMDAHMQAAQEAHTKHQMRLYWNSGQSQMMDMMLMQDPAYRAATGISEEQSQQYLGAIDEINRTLILPFAVPLPHEPFQHVLPPSWEAHGYTEHQFESPVWEFHEPHATHALPGSEIVQWELPQGGFVEGQFDFAEIPVLPPAPPPPFINPVPADMEIMEGATVWSRESWSREAEGTFEFVGDHERLIHFHPFERVEAITVDEYHAAVANAMNDILTPEQQRKMLEAQLVAMQSTPNFSPRMFEALDLTDTQRQQLEQIKEDIEPEFERFLDDHARNQVALDRIRSDEWQREWQNAIERGDMVEVKTMAQIGWGENMQEVEITHHIPGEGMSMPCLSEISKRLLAEDPEFRRLHHAIQARSREFSMLLNSQMLDVLTDEQWERFQELLDNPPEHVRVFLERLQMMRGMSGAMVESDGEDITERTESGREIWVPGPNSWRPGMPLPESFRPQQGPRNFPRERR